MMKILPGASLLLLLHSIDSYSQSLDAKLEDIALIRESLRTNTISYSRAENTRLILTVLKLDLERNGAEFLNLDPQRESVALTMISTLDLGKIEMEAIAPIMADMCLKLESGSADAVELASIYLQAEQAQNQAVDVAYDSIIDSLSDEGRVVVERIRETTAGDTRRLKYDWEGIARDVPVFVKGVLQNACIELSKPVTESTPSPTMPSSSTLSDGLCTN